MRTTYEVRVEAIRFDAAHFATYGGSCEPLHGHSYEVAAEARGSLNQDSLVINFTSLKAKLRELSREIDHRFLLQRDSTMLEIEETEAHWKVRTPAGIGYVLPRADVVALPIDNTTAERLAEWFSHRLWDSLEDRVTAGIESLTVDVWEGPGQRGSYQIERLPQG